MHIKIPRSRIVLVAGVLLAALVVGTAFAAAITVDSFDEASQSLTVSPVTTTANGVADDAGILGGERDAFITWVVGTGTATLDVDQFGIGNEMQFTEGSNVQATMSLTWDGNDNDATTLDHTGLGSADLTGGGTNDGFQIRVTFDDLTVPITLTVYTNATDYSDYTVTLPGGILSGQSVDFFARFTDFSTAGGAGATFSDVGAIVLDINGTVSPGTDVNVDFMALNDFREYGDLPTTYSAADRGGNHIPAGLRLGSNRDAEAAHQPTVGADGDDTATSPDDEDGVVPTPGFPWSEGAGGSIDITLSGCSGTCRFNGWIDFNDDGDFADSGEHILNDAPISNSGDTKTFAIPAGTDMTDVSLYGRFRVCSAINTCDGTADVDVVDGEVEDYRWSFGPTAVTLVDLTATANSNWTIPAAVALGLVVLILGGLVLYRRRGAAV